MVWCEQYFLELDESNQMKPAPDGGYIMKFLNVSISDNDQQNRINHHCASSGLTTGSAIYGCMSTGRNLLFFFSLVLNFFLLKIFVG